MKVVWKRPDGFHGAEPADFVTVDVGHSKLWLHKRDRDQFPFRISGGWEEEAASKRLNNLVNLLGQDEASVVAHLARQFSNSQQDEPAAYLTDLQKWLSELSKSFKGDTWETEIMAEALHTVSQLLERCRPSFLNASKSD